jgi:small-conductance mechanosensitive channel
LLDEHEATQHQSENSTPKGAPASANGYQAENLIAQLRAWWALRAAQRQLQQAQNESLDAVSALKQSHNALEKHVDKESVPEASPADSSKQAAAEVLSALRHRSADQKSLADLDKRIQDHQELAQNYGSWLAFVGLRQRIALHGVIQSGLWIVLILLMVYLIGRVIDRFFSELTAEHKNLRTLRVVVRFAAQAVGVLLILLVVVGAPSQTPTILGLAGAGLTVALKDFIVAFFGWFVLMGRNGIRVGDWVEINGVGGEVIEIGMLRTVLMETGNWNDAGHPTGRKVAFVNSFAIEGHFFNFSTTGQWLWDELQVLVPKSENPYPLIDAIQKLVTEQTAANSRMAEGEWQQATNRQRMQSFSAAPALNVRPTSEGVQLLVRYITRAHERHEQRSRLYQAIVDLLHQKKATSAMVGAGPGERR